MDAAKAALLYVRKSNGGYSLAPEGTLFLFLISL